MTSIVIMSLLFFFLFSVGIQCPLRERNYLLQFKASLEDNSNSTNLSSWQGFNCCEWEGVGCSRHLGGHVTLLDLADFNLRGEIHSSLFKLEYLQHLNLGYNFSQRISSGFHGQIPASLGNLWNLRFLELSSRGNPARLQSPRLASWLKNLTRLEHLSLDGVDGTSTAEEWGDVVATLSNLTYLRLSDCGLSGPLPSSIHFLSKLVHLDLSSNSLTGRIPPSLGQLSNLVDLHLGDNQLNGTIPSTISNLVRLKALLLYSNRLRGPISLSLFDNLTGLEQMVLSHNHLTVSTGSTWIPKFKKLWLLGLAFCNLPEFPSFLVNQYYMYDLDLAVNSIAGNIPTWIWDLPALHRLNLSCNQFTGSLPSKLQLKDLKFLDLHNNSLEGVLPLPPVGVWHLDLADNKFIGSIPSDIGTYLQEAAVFSLRRNNLSGSIPNSTCTIGMRVLDLSSNMLSGTFPANFTGDCLGLVIFNLAKNNLRGDVPAFGKLTNLQTLDLNGNHLQGAIAPSIANCISLQILNLGNNDLKGTIPQWIGNLSKLQILMLNSNRFQGTIPLQIIALPHLQILDLSDNKLSGSIPSSVTNLRAMVNASQGSPLQLGYQVTKDIYCKNHITVSTKDRVLEYEMVLTIFKFMDLSSNNLSGKIPPEMGSLQGLKGLNLSRNHLSGQIPNALAGMGQLESMDLSLNKLHGKIPLELQSLSYLQVFNVSYNMLEGKVPHGGQFLTFDESSFIGNAHLYDIPFMNNTGNFSSPNPGDAEASEAEEDSDAEIEWWEVSVGLSYGLGFSIVIGLLSFNVKIRKIVFHIYDDIFRVMFYF